MQNLQKIIISVLLVAVIIVGYLIYIKQSTSPLEVNKVQYSAEENTKNIDQESVSVRIDISKLLSENPKSGASQDELTAFSAKVSSYAVDTTSVDVSSCLPNPAVARVNMGKAITFKNSDSLPHRLVNGKITIDIPANSSKAISPAFPSPGIYGYSCDTEITGIFLVMP